MEKEFTLEQEVNMLNQSLDMYKNTLNEMLAHNANESAIMAVKAEINDMEKYLGGLVRTTPKVDNIKGETMQNVGKCSGSVNEGKDKEMTPIKIHNFLLHFPSKYKIVPYMIDSFYVSDDVITITIREFEGCYPILPIKIKDMLADKFDINVDILNRDETLYYTTVYGNCVLIDEIPLISCSEYNNSNIRTWTISFKYENIEYLTALPNIKPKY